MQHFFPAAEKSQSNAPATQQTSRSATPQSTSDHKRSRPDNVDEVDGTGNVYAFTDRLTSITELKEPKLVQTNIVTVHTGVALNWYHRDIADIVKWALSTNESIDPWCQAMTERFRPTQAVSENQLVTIAKIEPIRKMQRPIFRISCAL